MPGKIILTGSSGFAGSHLLSKLIDLGYQVTELDILKGIDITDWNQISDIKGIEHIIHLAARTFVPDSYLNPREFYQVNVTGTLNMLELARINHSKFIYASSYVYGEPDYIPIDEKHQLKAFNPYAGSKIIAEQLAYEYYRNYGLPVIVLRPFNLYGPGQNKNFLIPQIIEQAGKGEIILNDPDPKRDFLFIDDMTEAYVKCLGLNNSSFEVFNLGTGISYSVLEVAEKIINSFKNNISLKFKGIKRKDEVMDTVADITKARRVLNWFPEVGFEEGIIKCIN
jgi:nucleoside-diphosphate-sugar epimerase